MSDNRLASIATVVVIVLVLAVLVSGCIVTDKMWVDLTRTEEQGPKNILLLLGALALTPFTVIADFLLSPVTFYRAFLTSGTGAPPDPLE